MWLFFKWVLFYFIKYYCLVLKIFLTNFIFSFSDFFKNLLKSNILNIKNYVFLKNIFFKSFFSKNLFEKKKYRKIKKNSLISTNFKNNYQSFSKFHTQNILKLILKYLNFNINLNIFSITLLIIYKKTFGDGFMYIRGLFIIFFIDSLVIDDEPLWEPIEWSLVQTWILFIFIIAWIAENLITSRFGSYTGRDKRVWFAWYKTFWLIELWYALSYGAACMFVIVPFYYEVTYSMSFIFSWWNWCNRVFFFKFISIFTLIIICSQLSQIGIKWLSWKKLFFLILIINFFFLYLLYTQFLITFFSYFTDPIWYQKNRTIDYIQLSHEPLKWGWGPASRDHFSYHKTTTVFWFKNDGPFAGAFLMINLFFFISLFFTFFYFLILLRKVYTTKEVTYTFSTFCFSSLKQFFYFFLLLYILVYLSFIICYWRFPIEFFWNLNTESWVIHFFKIVLDYFFFLKSIF